MAKENIYLASKPRYEILDGLRGVAALMVIIFHCLETYIPMFGTQIVNHGYLAVDFFFVLSGFVIGYAYDDRWSKMSTWGFFKTPSDAPASYGNCRNAHRSGVFLLRGRSLSSDSGNPVLEVFALSCDGTVDASLSEQP